MGTVEQTVQPFVFQHETLAAAIRRHSAAYCDRHPGALGQPLCRFAALSSQTQSCLRARDKAARTETNSDNIVVERRVGSEESPQSATVILVFFAVARQSTTAEAAWILSAIKRIIF